MTTGTTREWQAAMALVVPAAMEPRRDDGDDRGMPAATTALNLASPQWSPVVTTGTTRRRARRLARLACRNGAPS